MKGTIVVTISRESRLRALFEYIKLAVTAAALAIGLAFTKKKE